MIQRINAYAARRFGVGTTAGSFVRMHVWAVVFLVLLSLMLPSRGVPFANRSTEPVVRKVTLDANDPRGFAPSRFGKDRFRIAWITGSEGHIADANYSDFVPNLVARHLPSIDGRKLGIDLYWLDGIRIGDIYFALLDAIETKPDMIVVSLNPTWVLSPLATHAWQELDSRAATQLLSKPRSWPIAADFFSPADLAWGVADKAFRPLRQRFYYSNRIHRIIDDFGPLDRRRLSTARATQKPTRYQRILSMTSVNFWFQYRFHEPRDWRNPGRWAQWIDKENEGKSALNKTILRAIARELRNSSIPSYVYNAPVNSHWLATSKPFGTAVGGVEQQLEHLRGNFTDRNILYQPLTATRFLPPLDFQDVMHLRRAGPMGPYLARQLCRLVAQTDETSTCRPNGGPFGA